MNRTFFGLSWSTIGLWLVVVSGILLRASFMHTSPFDFDQIQIERAAREIISGDLALVGPRTGPAQMFTGPLIYYVAAILAIVAPVGYSPAFTAVTLSVLTGVVVLLLSKKYLSPGIGQIFVSLWAFSPLLLLLDHTPWNPNLSFLAGAMVFIPLLKKSKLQLADLILVSIGTFLGYQAHFSGLLLVPLSLGSLLLCRRTQTFSWSFFGLPIVGFLISLMPTIVFDVRNNWYNTNGFIALLQGSDPHSQTNLADVGARGWEKLYIVIETTGKVIFQHNDISLVFYAGLVMLLLGLWHLRKQPLQLQLTAGWLLVTALSFALYSGGTPEYYFLLIVPTLLLIVSQVVAKLTSQPRLWIVSLILAGYGLVFSFTYFDSSSGLTVGNVRALTEQISTLSTQQPISEIVLDIPVIHRQGLEYLIDQTSLQLDTSGSKLHVVYPVNSTQVVDVDGAGNSGFIFNREAAKTRWLRLENYILSFPNNWQVAQAMSDSQADRHYLILDNNQISRAEILFLPTQFNSALKEEIDSLTEQSSNLSFPGFKAVELNSETVLVRVRQEWIVIFKSYNLTSADKVSLSF